MNGLSNLRWRLKIKIFNQRFVLRTKSPDFERNMVIKMKNMNLKNIAAACGGKLYAQPGLEEDAITCAVLDSRQIEKGGLFIATVGERADGHKFIPQVFEKGALCVLCEKTPRQVEAEHGVPASSWGSYILVEDCFRALREIAEFYRSQFAIPVVGITGSVGKTSTKEFIAGVLSEKYRVLKTEGNFNNEIGLPLTLLRLRQEHEAAVVEMGISDFGEMHRLSKMARPNICVITNIGQSHLNNLKNRAGILKAKTEIFDFMADDGYVCVNGDDDMLASLSVVKGREVLRYGLKNSDIYASDVENRGLLGSTAVMHMKGGSYPVTVPLPGLHMVSNAMAAAMVAGLLGLSAEEIQAGIARVQPVGGRSNILRLENRTVIDDCYNANPVSMFAALDLLQTALTRKVAILGDMFNLGENSDAMHEDVGRYAVNAGTDLVLCVGENARHMYDAALEAYDGTQDIRYFAFRDEMLEALPDLLRPEDTILVKASHDMGFAGVVEFLRKL